MIVVDIPQGEEAWFSEKLGRPSASRASEIVTSGGKAKNYKVSNSLDAYIDELAWERVLGTREKGYKNDAMDAGSDNEDRARAAYELVTGLEIAQVGCVYRDDKKDVLCSPDGLIWYIEEGWENKYATKRNVQTKRLRLAQSGLIEGNHFCQCQFSCWVCDWGAWRYQSYHDTLPAVRLRIERDDNYIKLLESTVKTMLERIEETAEEFRGYLHL